MRNFSKFIIIVFLCQLDFSCATIRMNKGTYQSFPIIADGKDVEWSDRDNFDEKNGFFFNLSNDSNFLYIRLKATDRNVVQKIMRFGFTVWVDTTGSTSKQIGIRCPVRELGHGGQPDQRRMVNPEEFARNRNRNEKIVMENEKVELTGFPSMPQKFTGKLADSPVQIGIQLSDAHELVYEAVIPMKMLFLQGEASLSHREVGIFAVTGHLELPSGMGNRGPGMPGMGPVPGQIPPGGRPGGFGTGQRTFAGSSENSMDLSELTNPSVLKIKHYHIVY